jgi:c-di-GMP-binding flagellar brake protein YcgR
MSVLNHLTNYKIVRILLPILENDPLARECVAHVTSAPFFEATFLDGQLPSAQLEREGRCQLIFEADGRSHSVISRIHQVVDENRLLLQAIEFAGFAQKREYFRVDTEIALNYRRLKDGRFAPKTSFRGSVNLSGSGVFFSVNEEIHLKERLALELFFGSEFGGYATAVGQVVRLLPSSRNRAGLGIQFVEIAPPERDKVISFCLAEQRRLLQTRVRILDQE